MMILSTAFLGKDMDVSLLATKFYFPIAKQSLVTRPRLIEHLKKGLQGPLTLISGSAGSGKTTLLSEWHAKTAQETLSAWLSLDEGDNDIHIFLAYLSAALDCTKAGLKQEILAILDATQSHEPLTVLKLLINSLNTLQSDCVLVLDDYQVISNPEIHTSVTFLVENAPPQLHLVLLSRVDPPLPLARLRSRGNLVELRDHELRFTLEEAAVFLTQVMDLRVNPDQVSALVRRTEGWVAGLQMAALSMQGRQDLANFVTAFTGSHRFVMDYLADEVLNRQTEDVRTFLLKTALLERLSADLCNTLTERTDSQSILEYLESANLFIIPQNDERRWYRYHHLFAELLRHHLKTSLPGQEQELHRQASQWYELHQFIESALIHAAAICDQDLIVNILCRNGLAIIDRGYTRLVNQWLATLPQAAVESNPVLALCMSICTYHIPPRNLARSEEWLQKAESALETLGSDPETTKDLYEKIFANRINLARMTETDPESILALIDDGLGQCPDMSSHQLAFIYFNQLEAYLSVQDLKAAERTLELIQALGPLPDDPYDQLVSTSMHIDLHAKQGDFIKAEHIYQASLPNNPPAEAEPEMTDPVVGFPEICYGEILLNIGRLGEAERFLTLGYEHLSATAEIAAQARALTNLTRLQFQRGNFDDALSLVFKTKSLQLEFTQSVELLYWLNRITEDASVIGEVERILMEQPFLPDAQIDLPGVLLREERRFYYQLVQAYAAIILFQEKRVPDLNQVLEFLTNQSGFAEAHDWKIRQAQLLMLHSLAWQALGDQPQAIHTLMKALLVAEAFGGAGVFLDFGPHLLNLLKFTELNYPAREPFTRKILALIINPSEVNPITTTPASMLIEPLTERERDVLRLMAAGLSNPEIAEQLYLSLNTIKTHTRGIYGKLGVNNRTQATIRADELGLI
jgi:LuxR family maltose regulon positive regulatory protein